MLQDIYYLIYSNQYIQAAVIFISFVILAKLFVFVSQNILLKIARKTKTEVDDKLIEATNKPISFLVVFIGARLAILPLGIGKAAMGMVRSACSSFIIIIVIYIAVIVFDILIDGWGKKWAEKTKSKVDDHLIVLLRRFSKIIFGILGLLFIMDVWGIKIGPLLASLGIAGIAVAFALQNTLGNIFGGISMIIDKTIKVGDMVQLEDGTLGTVLDVGLRSTRIRTFDNEVVIMPNGTLASSKVQNYVHPDPSARVVIPFSTAYGSKIEKVKKIVLKEISSIEGLKKTKETEPFVRFSEMGESSLNFKAFFWVENYLDRWQAKDVANTRIYNALNKAGISIPFPQMDIWIKEHKKKR
jgi:MscS family membrane protein